jgi:hypothetical protein
MISLLVLQLVFAAVQRAELIAGASSDVAATVIAMVEAHRS